MRPYDRNHKRLANNRILVIFFPFSALSMLLALLGDSLRNDPIGLAKNLKIHQNYFDVVMDIASPEIVVMRDQCYEIHYFSANQHHMKMKIFHRRAIVLHVIFPKVSVVINQPNLHTLKYSFVTCYFSPRFFITRGARARIGNSASCNLRPNTSSCATNNKSFSKLKLSKTLAYAPNATVGSPRSMARSVLREIPARADTKTAEKRRRNRARRICSPSFASVR